MEAEEKGARKMLGVQSDSWSSHTSTLELVQSHAVRWLQSCDAASKVTAPWAAAVGRCSHPWAAAGEEMPALTSSRTCRAKHPACPSRASECCHHHLQHTGSAFRGGNALAGTASTLVKQREARGPLPGLSTSATAHEVKLWLLKQTVKQMGCYVHLLYLWLCIIMITGWLPWTVQAVKGGQLCFTTLFHTKQIQRYPIA